MKKITIIFLCIVIFFAIDYLKALHYLRKGIVIRKESYGENAKYESVSEYYFLKVASGDNTFNVEVRYEGFKKAQLGDSIRFFHRKGWITKFDYGYEVE